MSKKVFFHSIRVNAKGHATLIATSAKMEQTTGTVLGVANVSTRKSTPINWAMGVFRQDGEFCTLASPLFKAFAKLKVGDEIPTLVIGEEIPPIPGRESTSANKWHWIEVAE